MGVTFAAIAAEHPLALRLAKDKPELQAFIDECRKGSVSEADMATMEKKGVPTGFCVKHPLTGADVPVWIGNYVLMTYGEGAVMGVPAHDERDFAFALKYGLPIKQVIGKKGEVFDDKVWHEWYGEKEATFCVNSGKYDGMDFEQARDAVAKDLEALGLGKLQVQYRLRDWSISRQRYWGTPIPMINCPHCGPVPVPEKDLPVILPEDLIPDGSGNPLNQDEAFLNCKCPKCGAAARRETDTMPQWAGSSWYFLRYCDPHNDKEFASQEALQYWMPVDWYNGGMEHVTRHMIYSRFWHKFLYDLGLVPTSEPYAKRTAQGLILGPDGEKMSKSRGNVVDPNDVVDVYGADVLRLYVLFMGDYEKAAPWSENSVKGCKRFIDRIWALQDKVVDSDSYSDALRSKMHKTIKKVSGDIESMKFNTAIAAMMTLLNDIYDAGSITRKEFRDLLILLYPFAPHVSEELYQVIGCEGVLSEQEWVTYDEALCVDDTIEIVVQINGKVKAKLEIPADAEKDAVLEQAAAEPKIAEATAGKNIIKQIYVPKKLVNFVVK